MTTTEAPDGLASTPKPLIVDEMMLGENFQTVETGSSSSQSSASLRSLKKDRAEGRKSSMPKRLRLSGDLESCSSPSPGCDDGIAVSEEETELDQLERDQPMDFTKTKLDNSLGLNGSRFSILGSYLKSGLPDRPLLPFPGGFLPEDLKKPELAGSWLEPLANLARSAPRPDSRDSRGDSRDDRDHSGEENTAEERGEKDFPGPGLRGQGSLTSDLANKLRSHFLANLPAQSYAWLASSSLPASGGGGGGGGGGGYHPSWLNNISERCGRSQASLLDNKMDKHPMGGIR